jgi:CHAT domain-containing protein/tetratricopeptide (TPR) repeat protein
VPRKSVTFGAIIGSTLMALSLVGSYGNPAILPKLSDKTSLAEVMRLHALGKAAFSEGRYQDAREAFWAAAAGAMRVGSARDAAMNWSNAGFASVIAMQYRTALEDLSRARRTAEAAGEMVPLIYTLSNLAGLYLQMGAPEDALHISQEALAGPAGHANAGMRGILFNQEAQALTMLGRFPEAEPIFRQSLAQIMDAGNLDAAARWWAGFGSYYIDAGRYEDAERALSEALRLVRTHHLKAAASVLSNLAKLRGKQGDSATAEHLFQEALDAHETVTPLWLIYYDRGSFRLETGSTRRALEDFRESRRLAIRMRADIVPADHDRVALESRVSRIFEALVDAGNRYAIATNDKIILAETFDAAEQDRLWSLRALVPEPNDWRSRLPAHYWELLVRFQSAERSLIAEPSSDAEKRADDLRFELQQAEAAAGGTAGTDKASDLPSRHVKDVLDPDSVLFSFSITETSSWLWVVDRGQMRVYALPSRERIKREVSDFTRALQDGQDSKASGRQLYATLFGKVPATVLARKRWLLEPDGPLYDLPFAALPVDEPGGRTAFLIERVALQTIPGALLLERGAIQANGAFVGIGDPVFNQADPRYRPRDQGSSMKAALNKSITLPRLPNTAAEVAACSRAWASDSPQLLTGSAANRGAVESALATSPAVIHFATHVVNAPGEFGSGLIALGLDAKGAIGLMGPEDIAARRVAGSLVVMNGCHSAQGDALPGSGLMGLTRAWIGAGANAVLSTRWDVPDESAQSLMVSFYRALRYQSRGNPAAALRQAQLEALHSGGQDSQPSRWSGYFLLSRI